MEESWIGKAVSIQCNEKLGVFQGTIKDASNSQITIVRAFRNGVPLRKQDAEVTLSASDIVKLELIPTYNAQSTVTPTVINKPTPVKQPNFGAAANKESTLTHRIANMKLSNGHRRSPTEKNVKCGSSKSPSINSTTKTFGNMIPPKVEVKLGTSLSSFANQENGGAGGGGGGVGSGGGGAGSGGSVPRNSSKPIDIARSAPQSSTPLKQERKKSRREARIKQNHTFGTPVDDPIMGEDFDFEGNLALFDKQAIWDEIEATQKPDLVRQAVSAQRRKYRHDENVLTSEPTQLRQIESLCHSSHDFVTDEGLIIPSIPLSLRTKIQQLAENHGLTCERQCDILARGTADLAILLLGGARRLTPNNRHQWPTIAIISDEPQNTKSSNVGAATGRHLASHGLNVMLHIKEQEEIEKANTELELYKATGNNVVHSVEQLPSSDLVILSVNSSNLSSSIKKWLTENRSSILAIDPPQSGINDISIKCSILPILPLNNITTNCGKLYLCNLGIPDKYYKDSGIKYKSPFGHKFVIPIHMKD